MKEKETYINQGLHLEGAAYNSDLRYTATGVAMLEFTLAMQSRGTEGPTYLRIKALGQAAERAAEQIKDGMGVKVLGRFESYKSEAGERHSVLAQRLWTFEVDEGDLTAPDSKGQRRLLHGINEFWAVGNLTRDVEFSYGESGVPFARGTLAISLSKEKTDFLPFVAFGPVAEALKEGRKGARMLLSGRLKNDSWTDKEGQKRYGLKLEVEVARKGLKEAREEAKEEKAAGALEDFPETLPF
ncbi:MAG: single-stranded DNA-binding protein [Meiothermus sp.]|nr:single-stranded DNA-binding protein [Meiothermus sp.]GIW31399.1 MAG: single-stranded DNA-binding protein [Meiothermus sp.]